MIKGSLFPRLAFSPDETHDSWAGRLAVFHSGGGVEAFLNDMKIPRLAFLNGHSEFVEALCTIAGQDPEPVLNNTVLRAKASEYRLKDELFGSAFLIGKLTKFCPVCLLEDDATGGRTHAQRREHLAWRFRSVHVCPIHQLYLVSAPSQMDRQPDLSSRVPADNDLLRMLAERGEPAKPSPAQSYLMSRFAGERGPEWLDGQAIDHAVRATEMLGAVIEFGHQVNIDNMTTEEWHRAACVGWEWTSKGEEGLRDAFQILQAAGTRAMDARDRHPGYMFGRLYSWLALKNTRDDRGPIRDVLRRHIIETEPITTDRKILGVEVSRNQIKPKNVGQSQRYWLRTRRHTR